MQGSCHEMKLNAQLPQEAETYKSYRPRAQNITESKFLHGKLQNEGYD